MLQQEPDRQTKLRDRLKDAVRRGGGKYAKAQLNTKRNSLHRFLTTDLTLISVDLNGTLVDTIPPIVDTINEARIAHSVPLISIEQFRRDHGRGLNTLLRELVPETNIHQILSMAVDRMSPKNTYPGIQDFLQSTSCRVIVTTNVDASLARSVLNATGLIDVVDLVVGSVDKPRPDALLRLLDEFILAPNNACLVGDSQADILAASAAGILSVHVGWGYGQDDDPVSADVHISSPDQLMPLLSELSRGVCRNARKAI